MSNIFLSRPTWIDLKYEKGLSAFINFLSVSGQTPRTLGATDYPNNSPLDEVIKLMKECSGAIILGYPQIIVDSGIIKDTPIQEPMSLGTEWNHIEAALAYSLQIPLLVIHDSSVSRGVFEKGTLNSYIYSVNFEDPSWFMEQNILGALKTWINRLNKI